MDLVEWAGMPVDESRDGYNYHPGSLDDPRGSAGGGFTSPDFFRAVMAAGSPDGRPDPRLYEDRAATGLGESQPSEGGFLVNTDFSSDVIGSLYDTQTLPGMVRRIQISGNSNGIKINAVNETSRADGSRQGGLRSYWISEAGEKTASKPSFRQMQLSLKKLVILVYSTDELLADAVALESFLRDAVRREFAFKVEDMILNGTGAGQGLGVLNGGGLVAIEKETGQDPDTIIWANIEKMYARFKPLDQSRSVFVCNRDTIPQLFSMVQVVGTGGIPVWTPANGASPFDRILGQRVVYSEASPTLGDEGDILLFDPTQYIIAEKGGIQSAQSIHVRFINDETVFRFVWRVDGQPIPATTLAPFKGTTSQSPFVILQTRS